MGCSLTTSSPTANVSFFATPGFPKRVPQHPNQKAPPPSLRSLNSGAYEVVDESLMEAGMSHREEFGGRFQQSSGAMMGTSFRQVLRDPGDSSGSPSPHPFASGTFASGTDLSECPIGDRFHEETSTRALELSNDENSAKDIDSADSLEK